MATGPDDVRFQGKTGSGRRAVKTALMTLTRHSTASPYKQAFAYDTLGSIIALGGGAATSTYTYAGTASYANPHALTSLSNGYSTTTYAYDADGNVTQKTTDGTTTTYFWDYANRLTALGVAGQGTTTYAYDALGQRVLQTGTSTTWIYPFKWYSVASSTGTGTKYSTTTEYVFNGDALLTDHRNALWGASRVR